MWQEPNGDTEHQTSPLYWDGGDFTDVVPDGHCSSDFMNGGSVTFAVHFAQCSLLLSLQLLT